MQVHEFGSGTFDATTGKDGWLTSGRPLWQPTAHETVRVHEAVAYSMIAPDPGKEENQSNVEAPLPAVSANTLARCLGVTPKTIYDLMKEGVIERGSSRLFKLEDSVRRYCEHLRRQMGKSS